MYVYEWIFVYIYVGIYIYYKYIEVCVLVREMGMDVHAAALSPMHTWVRLARADDAAVAITCACARVRPPAYVANAHVMCQYTCIYTSTQSPGM
jgi:hypothetical protein